ncbi:hypothetical protein P43SY_009261 [Pythium insidiosum]|uniref:CCT domain-containing protein n=1 Tax=Pythium insidiosum TaxID=114742 RepID=A0AAD5QBB8_PYTIN|nr:hypothetical protein P43SY_009261 [Pythium insidiosum]
MHRCAVEKELEAADSIQEDPLLRRAGVSPLLTGSKEDAGFSLPELEFSPRLGPQGDAKSEVSSPLVLHEDDERWHHLSLLPQDSEAAKSPRIGRGLEATTDLLPSLLDDDEELRLRIDAPLNMDAMIPFPLQTPTQRIVGFHSFFHRPDGASRSGLVSPFKDSVRLLSPTAMDKKVLVTDNDLKLVSAEESPRVLRGRSIPQSLSHRSRVAPYKSTRKSSSSRDTKEAPETESADASSGLHARRWRDHTHAGTPFGDAPHPARSPRAASPSARRSPVSQRRERLFPPFAQDSLAGYEWGAAPASAAASRASCRLPGIAAFARTECPGDWQSIGREACTLPSNRAAGTPWSAEQRPMPRVRQSAAILRSPREMQFASPPARPMRLRPMRKIGIYTPEQRRERIRRFHEKRKQRVFHKRVKYDCRKRLAIACPRIKGRFVKREEYEQAMAAASAEAQDDAAWQSHSTRSEEEDEEYACDVGHGTGLTDEESAPSEVAVSPWMPEVAADATLPSSFLGDLEPNHPGASELLQIKV